MSSSAEWGYDNSRIDVIGQNGNTGEHYVPSEARDDYIKKMEEEYARSKELEECINRFHDDKPLGKYSRIIQGIEIDVYDILEAYNVSHPIGHAIKKLLMAGERGAKGREQDLDEAIMSIKRGKEL